MSETFLVLERAVQADRHCLRSHRENKFTVAYEKLDELCRFRHLFRSAYGVQLDAERLRLVLRKAVQLHRIYLPQMESFLEFVRLCSKNVESSVHATRSLSNPRPVPRSAISRPVPVGEGRVAGIGVARSPGTPRVRVLTD